jgi:UDP-N-acetylglucosamine 2-epimerase (non-hydrolysing)
MKVLTVIGTRPEAIKMCPLVMEFEAAPDIDSRVCLTGQHREMLQQVIDVFAINVDHRLDIMREQQSIHSITVDVLDKITPVFSREKPDIVFVHGDTTTTFSAALAAFYQQIPVAHVEAGLRTHDRYSPFPEEMNRGLVGRLATLHFAPTQLNARNLQNEGIDKGVFVTGNTVIDAFKTTVRPNYCFKDECLANLARSGFKGRRVITLTAHRRENLGDPLRAIFTAIRRLHDTFSDTQIIYPVHPNPAVREPAYEILSSCERIALLDPVNVLDMHNLLSCSYLVLTDSGGLQEETPAFGVPVLVLRTETERPEAVVAGTVKVVGVEEDTIYEQASLLLTSENDYQKMAHAVNPYGDGHASKRILNYLLDWSRGLMVK